METGITWKIEGDRFEVRLVYIIKHSLRMYSHGKSWPKHTQCLMFIDGLFAGHGEVVKHESDEDDMGFAIKGATKQAMKSLRMKDIRTDLWKKVFYEIALYEQNKDKILALGMGNTFPANIIKH